MNAERIGQAAGTVWSKLHEKGPEGLAFTDVKKIPGFTSDEILAGIGWLAREGKLFFKTEGKKFQVSLVGEGVCV